MRTGTGGLTTVGSPEIEKEDLPQSGAEEAQIGSGGERKTQ
jgi:hypothetical protein